MFGLSKRAQEPVAAVNFHTEEEIEKEISEAKYDELASSTTLTPHELYLLQRMGYRPVQVVFGNVVYSMGVGGFIRTVLRALKRGELTDFSRLNKDARLLARNRMIQEAKTLGAEMVVGVKFDTREYADFIEVVAIGTAVRADKNLSAPPKPDGDITIGV